MRLERKKNTRPPAFNNVKLAWVAGLGNTESITGPGALATPEPIPATLFHVEGGTKWRFEAITTGIYQ